jgi:hypothetical protein
MWSTGGLARDPLHAALHPDRALLGGGRPAREAGEPGEEDDSHDQRDGAVSVSRLSVQGHRTTSSLSAIARHLPAPSGDSGRVARPPGNVIAMAQTVDSPCLRTRAPAR